MMRLVNDETEAPNVHLMYWPEERKDPPRLPRRCFLVAKRDVPPLTELTWDYGKQYRRPWLVEEASDEGATRTTMRSGPRSTGRAATTATRCGSSARLLLAAACTRDRFLPCIPTGGEVLAAACTRDTFLPCIPTGGGFSPD